MSPPPLRRCLVLALVLAQVVVVGACGSDRTGGPRGRGEAIVGAAPSKSLSAGQARFDVAVPEFHAQGVVHLADGTRTPDTRWPEQIPLHAEPTTAVALVEGAVDVVSYGGQAIRGQSAFRYELDLAPDKALRTAPVGARPGLEALAKLLTGPTLFADVWIDDLGRILRVQMPLDPNQPRPRGYSKVTPDYVTVDLYDYQKGP